MSKEPRKSTRFLALTGIGIQMGATIFLGAWAGRELDEAYPSNKKWWTMGLTIFAVIVSLYSVLKQVNRINKQEDDEKNR
ncbi:MAG: AtpZ/AtpI family protein [bacterium]|nr:AtpZ/AtpI family protein [bacterium]